MREQPTATTTTTLRRRHSQPQHQEANDDRFSASTSSISPSSTISSFFKSLIPQPTENSNDNNSTSAAAAAAAANTNHDNDNSNSNNNNMNTNEQALRQLFCGGVAGSVAKTVTAPFSRLTILWQVHSMVTTRENRPKFALTLSGGIRKVVERGGLRSLWRGNMTSVLHRFPYSAINFYVYEHTLDALSGSNTNGNNGNGNGNENQRRRRREEDEVIETGPQLMRRVTKIVMRQDDDDDDADYANNVSILDVQQESSSLAAIAARSVQQQQHSPVARSTANDSSAKHKFMAGAMAGTVACCACYPLDLIRTRLTTELEGKEHFTGIADAFKKTLRKEGFLGFYSGIGPTLLVAVPNFAMSYTIYGSLKEFCLDDELFYNLRRIDADSGEPKMGFFLTILCGAASGSLATLLTFPMDTIRRRMQIQGLHVANVAQRKTSRQLFHDMVSKEGLLSLYRGLTPELLKVIPMVGTMFVTYEWTRELLNVGQNK
jgi:Mitochondrial carrier protein